MFCKKCGARLDDDACFCTNCGANVALMDVGEEQNGKNVKKREFIEGTIHKCPRCGEVVKAFETQCPSCGYEFRDTSGSSKVEEFSKKIQELEAGRKEKNVRFQIASYLGIGTTEKTDKEIISLIKTFNVPNNVEDICEFLILACSSINVSVAEENAGANGQSEFNTMKAINEAWIAKADQVYEKAFLSFANDPKFARIDEIYKNKKTPQCT